MNRGEKKEVTRSGLTEVEIDLTQSDNDSIKGAESEMIDKCNIDGNEPLSHDSRPYLF